MAEQTIQVQVTYADPVRQITHEVLLVPGSTVLDAIRASGIEAMIPAGSVDSRRLGIFSRKVGPDHPVDEGDRIEIYRELALDPMVARRRRAR